MIPKQLKPYRFIKTNGKKPIEKSWTTDTNYNYEDMQKYEGSSYGVLCGFNGLVVVDCDNEEINKKLLQVPLFAKTFQVKTAGKGLTHFYFKSITDKTTTRFKDISNTTICDLQGIGTMVVGPGTKIKDKSYQVVNDVPIVEADYDVIQAKIKSFIPDCKITDKKIKKKELDKYYELDNIIKQIKQKIKVEDVLKDYGIPIDKNPTECPFHASAGKGCLSFTEETWHCFDCEESGNIFHLYMKLNDVDFVIAKHQLAKKANIKLDPIQVRNQFELFIKKHHTDQAIELMVESFMLEHFVKTIRDDDKFEMWIYSDGIYIPQGRSFIKEHCRAILQDLYKARIANQVVERIEADTYIDKDKFFENKHMSFIPVQNGILNIFKHEIQPFNEKYKFFNKINAEYNPDAKCPNIISFFNDVLSNEEDILLMQEIFGYCLYRDYKFHKAFMYLGDGRNGKGVTMELHKTFLGVENCSSISLQMLTKDQYSTIEVHNKMANLGADIGKAKLDDTQRFKELTGHDPVSANRKFKTHLTFTNYAKMIFAANTLPETSDNKTGWMSRWEFLDFKNTYVVKKEYDKMSEYERKAQRAKIQDQYIIEKMNTPEEMSGLLNWSLEGLDRLMKQKNFSKSSTSQEIEIKWKRHSNSVHAFMMDMIEMTGSPDDIIPTDDIKTSYTRYCMDHRIKDMKSYKDIKETIETSGSNTRRKRYGPDTKVVFLGIRWRLN